MLFPHCTFRVLIPHGVVLAGRRLEGSLEIDVPEPIPRARHVDLTYVVSAWAGYGSGKNRRVVVRNLFCAPLKVMLPEGVLGAGKLAYPFAIDVPAWVPPGLEGNDCGIQHKIETRLDVDWALDPKAVLQPVLAMAPQQATHAPLTVRSPVGFHESIVLEVTLASSVIGQNEPLSGQVALRSGFGARFDAVELSFVNVSRINMGGGDVRRTSGIPIRVPESALRGGEAVPFVFPAYAGLAPTFRNAFFDNDVILVVSVDIPWASDPELVLPIYMLPAGSTIYGETSIAPVGSARLRQSAAVMARETGLGEGRAPVLIEGALGPVSLRIVDAPREGKIGVEAELVFPDVELGTSFRPLGLLDGFRDSPLLSEEMRKGYFLRCEPHAHAPIVDDATLTSFFATLTAGLAGADELRLSDHHIGAHFALADDDGKRMVELALFLRAKAIAIADAIARLPFPNAVASNRATWQAVAAEQGAFLVPTGPSLHGLTFGAQLFDGEQRVLRVSIRTVWSASGPATRVEIDLSQAAVPEAAWADFEGDGARELVRAVREAFPAPHIHQGGATLERAGFTADPRELFSGIEAFLAWVLEARGERRADAPYR